METTIDTISVGDYIVLQRQKYTKLHKFNSLDSTAMLGKDLLELRNIESKPYFTTFKMVPKNGAKGKRANTLEPCTDKSAFTENLIASKGSGIDNRNITDDGSSQSLTPDEIQKLRDECSSSSEIVSQIVENSKTFASKTEYSQEKYLKKKEKKYFEFVQIKRPNIRTIADIMYRQSADKIYGIRMDQLSQLLSYSGVCGVGNYLLYESGTNGLVPAALLNSIGSDTEAKLVHMHPGNVPQRQALLALNLKQEQLSRCVSVNLYSVLRQYYQGTEPVVTETILESGKHKLNSDDIDEINGAQPAKLLKLDGEANGRDDNKANGDDDKVNENSPEINKKPAAANKEQWMIDNERACVILKDQVDALVICAKEHPSTILKSLLPFVKPSRPIVIYNTSREILAELYMEMKSSYSVTNLKITSNWMRSYQILPNRTHPEINMTGNSGFLLTGYTVR
ncbi:tRNA (adenine(58)-N(1))-methyltransferase non-catalytic subunit TRM6 [Bradysia coprophila]|uniref:tRNA (adenine(58)-N(1))-methyltransferase non-catalytic subunit TRM6 n=1 Tax=Bradysia coprophila TaxID=38358 RepID=UPI00187DCB33|nr:tRNA (adenine(58)-N(1))-methyltransferase non-catalytic subunit TRM6 [Bradysia coprophila]